MRHHLWIIFILAISEASSLWHCLVEPHRICIEDGHFEEIQGPGHQNAKNEPGINLILENPDRHLPCHQMVNHNLSEPRAKSKVGEPIAITFFRGAIPLEREGVNFKTILDAPKNSPPHHMIYIPA